MSVTVLDAGALIALESDDRGLWGALKLAARRGEDVLVPSTALAQVWRGGPAQAHLSRALEHCVVAPFDAHARAVGELCGKAGTRDICDAHAAITAVASGGVLYTSDVADLRRLVRALGCPSTTILRC